MEGELKKFIERFFTRHGALVEPAGEEALEILAPKELAAQLGMPEWEQFYFSDGAAGSPAALPRRRLGYDSDVLESMGKIVERHGLLAAARLPPLPVKTLDRASDIEKALVLQNAVFKLHDQEQTWATYMIFNFKYTAYSDERREGLLSLAVNEATLNMSPGLVEGLGAWDLAPGPPEPPGSTLVAKSFAEVYTQGCRMARAQMRATMADFVKSLNRRMERDLQRIIEYYSAIQQEIALKIKKKKLTGADRERELSRVRATSLEHERKMRDVQEKYNLDVKVELINLMRLFLPVALARLKILRRKWTLDAALAWNPVTRDLEKLTCLSCYQPSKRIFICDDRLHTVCADCFPSCPTCGYPFCAACHAQRCPRCRKG